MLISLGNRASVAVVEEFTASSATAHYFANAVTEINLAEGAQLVHRCVLLVIYADLHVPGTHVSRLSNHSLPFEIFCMSQRG